MLTVNAVVHLDVRVCELSDLSVAGTHPYLSEAFADRKRGEVAVG